MGRSPYAAMLDLDLVGAGPLHARYLGPDTDARQDVLGKEAASLGVTPGRLVLAWLLHQTDPAMIPLIGPRTFAQYEVAMAALDIKLDADTLRRLDEAGG